MNKNLVYFSFLLILLGIGFGAYIVSFIGLIALIPALLSPSRPPVRPPTPAPKQEAKRVNPRVAPIHQPDAPAVPEPPSMSYVPPPAGSQTQGYSSALFPIPLFPSLSQMGVPVQQTKETSASKPEGRDDLVEAGAILALLKLVLG